MVTFLDAAGQPKSLADWHGRTVLLNLWATWCVPCRKEMPALDALEQKLGAPDFEVVAVNIDTRDPAKPKTWLRDIGIDHLGYYSDASAKVFQDFKAVGKAIGMPTTLLVDPNGCEIASLAGPAEWASDDGIRLRCGAALLAGNAQSLIMAGAAARHAVTFTGNGVAEDRVRPVPSALPPLAAAADAAIPLGMVMLSRLVIRFWTAV